MQSSGTSFKRVGIAALVGALGLVLVGVVVLLPGDRKPAARSARPASRPVIVRFDPAKY